MSSKSVYVDPHYPDRHDDFQGTIHLDDLVEALQMALINFMLKSGCHWVIQNCSTIPGMMLVLVLSRLVLVNDVPSHFSVITYSRKIITSYGRKKTNPIYQLINDLVAYFQYTDNLPWRVIDNNVSLKPTVSWEPSQTQSELDLICF
jgi:hypothetical protein